MNNIFENLLKLLLILLNSLNFIICRDLSIEVNPNCPEDCSKYKDKVNLVHIKSIGENDIIHYLWSSITCIPPTLLIVETDLKTELNMTRGAWTNNFLTDNVCQPNKDLKQVISFSGGQIKNSIGFQFTRLFFLNVNNKSDPILELNWDFSWNGVTKKGDSIQLNYKNNNTEESLLNGTIAFDLKVDKSDGRNEELPHLSFTQKSVSLQISVNEVQTNKFFNDSNEKPRLMAEIFVMTGGQTPEKAPHFDSITSIDDEYTPGVFHRIVLDIKNVKNSFLSWKPIAYNSNERIIANTLDVINGDLEAFNASELIPYNSRIFQSFFNESNPKLKFNLTFGAADDETYYNEKRINAFSLVVGVDAAPDESLSSLVMIIIVVGFGLPLIVMIVSAMYLIVRKIRKRKFNDLLLNRSEQTLVQ